MNELVIPFSLTATQVNALGGTPVVLTTFPADSYVRVISRVEIVREAGTAYTITTPDVEGAGDTPSQLFNAPSFPNNYADKFQGGAFLQFEVQDDDGRGQAVVRVPADGFLSSPDEQRRLTFAARERAVYRPAFATNITVRSTVPLASGTGSVRGYLYYEAYPVGGY